MTDDTIPSFIVIDDDPINNHICRKYIEVVFPNADIITFTDPLKGLEYIQTQYPLLSPKKTILFLDINMPVLSGWQVLDRLMNCSEAIKQQFEIYILSSSVDIEDKQKANDSPLVSCFILKPMSLPKLQTIFSDRNKE